MAALPFSLKPALFQHLIRYVPVKPLKTSGPERIYLAQETPSGRLVVVKLLQEDPAISAEVYARRRQRLIRSGITLSKLRHPNIVEACEFGAPPDGVFVVMEYLEGGSLDQKLASFGALEGADLCSMVSELASGLDFAHRAGVVHCDIRPGQIMFDAAGRSRLMGFASARSPGATSIGGGVSLPASLVFAAPEQLQCNIEAATDQFCLAAVTYRALTGRRPFRATEVVPLIRQILTEAPEPPTRARPGLPKAVDRVLEKALARNPDDRFPDCSQFADAFGDACGLGRTRRLWARVNTGLVRKWMRSGQGW